MHTHTFIFIHRDAAEQFKNQNSNRADAPAPARIRRIRKMMRSDAWTQAQSNGLRGKVVLAVRFSTSGLFWFRSATCSCCVQSGSNRIYAIGSGTQASMPVALPHGERTHTGKLLLEKNSKRTARSLKGSALTRNNRNGWRRRARSSMPTRSDANQTAVSAGPKRLKETQKDSLDSEESF